MASNNRNKTGKVENEALCQKFWKIPSREKRGQKNRLL